MKVMVLGATGHLGERLLSTLPSYSDVSVVGTSRTAGLRQPGATPLLKLDTLDGPALASALKGFDAVVNCVAGDAHAISEGARLLANAALAAQCPRIIHLSTMSVYGSAEGRVSEDAMLDPGLGWYGKAKCDAEAQMADFARAGGEVVVLRPGCVFGPGSKLWVSRIGKWLQSGRLGDLGIAGDGWSNLVHVDNVCQAIGAALHMKMHDSNSAVFNLAAPDSPRWNDYFVDLALALGATPVRRVSSRQLRLDAMLAGPPLKIAEIAMARLGRKAVALPDAISPGLPHLWAQHIRLDSSQATQTLNLTWTPYRVALQASVDWFLNASASQLPAEKSYARTEG